MEAEKEKDKEREKDAGDEPSANRKPSSGSRVGPAADPTAQVPAVLEYPPSSSKYDFVKVKVWLEDHYYILSRFLISRVLGTTQVPYADSVKISLELKKQLVDRGMLEVQQAKLEDTLFGIMATHGYGEEYRKRWQMMSRFHHERVPLIIIISGTGLVGKSFLATQLAERLNLPNVLQTNLVLEFMEGMSAQGKLGAERIDTLPILYRSFPTKDALLEEYKMECRWVKKGIETDMEKALIEGKSVMVEGTHIDPALYMDMIAKHSIIPPPPALPTCPAPTAKSNIDPAKKGIIIPLVFNLNEEDHRLFMENALSRSIRAKEFSQRVGDPNGALQSKTILKNAKVIEKYLDSFSPPFEVVNVNVKKYFIETLNELHSRVLAAIQQAYRDGRFLNKEKDDEKKGEKKAKSEPAAHAAPPPQP